MQNRILIGWGTGKVCKKILYICKMMDVIPNFLTDSSPEKWHKKIFGIEIIPPEDVFKSFQDAHIAIFCGSKFASDIKQTLLEKNFNPDFISSVTNPGELIFEKWFVESIKRNSKKIFNSTKKINQNRVIFCLDNGATCGGVETWAIQQGEFLEKNNINSYFILNYRDKKEFELPHNSQVISQDPPEKIIRNWVEAELAIANNNSCWIVVNFAGDGLQSAILAKLMNPYIHICAVQHSDAEIYYDEYLKYERYFDICLTVSNKIKVKLIQRGFSPEKIEIVPWHIDLSKKIKKINLDGPLTIGYVGRTTIYQKRTDLFASILSIICQETNNIDFEIAGTGDYLPKLKNIVENNKLNNRVHIHGLISHDEINKLYDKMDIYISSSDSEGKSIALAEAMSNGVVPVVTDVSGSDDLIEDGVNGFIVPIHDVDAVVSKIKYLNKNRDLIMDMSVKAREAVSKMNNEYEIWKYKMLNLLNKN